MDNNNYSHTISYENTPWIGEDIQNITSNNNDFTGINTFASLLSAPAGVSALFFNGGTGTFSNITATSANFSGLVTGGSFSGGTAIFGALSCTSEVDLGTLGVSGQATFGSGIAGTTASFSGLIISSK